MLLRRLSRAGFPFAFVRRGVLPDWWDPTCDDDRALLADAEFRIARFLGTTVTALRDPESTLGPQVFEGTRLRKVGNIDTDRLAPAIHVGVRLAEAVVRSLREPERPVRLPPRDAREWWSQLRDAYQSADLNSIAADLWARGIPVVHVEALPSPKYQGMACVVLGRPVIIMGHDHDAPSRLAYFIAHEAAHLAFGDCAVAQPVVDAEDEAPDTSEIEVRADAYATAVLGDGRPLLDLDTTSWKEVAKRADAYATENGVDAGVVVWSWATRTRRFETGQMALNALYLSHGGQRVLRDLFDKHVDTEAAAETDVAMLGCVSGSAERNAAAP